MTLGKRSFSRFNEFQHNVARGREHNWRCRSGSRYLYICEDGLVHWCSQQRGYPGIPLAEYTPEMRHREYFTEKFCAPRCTVSCVQQVGILDNWRGTTDTEAAGRWRRLRAPGIGADRLGPRRFLMNLPAVVLPAVRFGTDRLGIDLISAVSLHAHPADRQLTLSLWFSTMKP